MDMRIWALSSGIVGLAFVVYLSREVLREPEGTPRMRQISLAIRRGATAFLIREYLTLSIFVAAMSVVLALLIEPRPWTGAAYVLGAAMSALAGFIGMAVATRANARTANAAKASWARALRIAFSSGAVTGLSVVSLGLLGITVTSFFTGDSSVFLGLAFGASTVALFLRVGGGIFSKSADVGADMVGKVEKGIPEDDPRNAAIIADNVGDNVGDVAGMGSDLHESYVSVIIAAMIIGLATFGSVEGMMLPLMLGATGIIVSIIGVLVVRPGDIEGGFQEQVSAAQKVLNRGIYVSNAVMVGVSFLVITGITGEMTLFWALITGLVVGSLISLTTEYYTSASRSPAKNIAKAAGSGAAFNIIEGLSTGMLSTAPPAFLISVATILSFYFGGLLGIAIAALGMLVNLGIVLAMDCYGPIADNAAGIAEMSRLGRDVRERCEALDAVGNTTAALGKGFAIASATLAALAWLATYFEVTSLEVASLTDPAVVVGVLIGGLLTFVFSSITMKAVGRGGFEIAHEVRRQFREIPGLMEGTAEPNYVRCVDIATRRALRSMVVPGVLAIAAPVVVGLALGLAAVAGLLVGALVTGFLNAVMMANAGGAWDNAKKYVEAGNLGGKNSETHKATIVGDTVGDPFKDTAGPSLNILIKLVGVVAVVFAPLYLT